MIPQATLDYLQSHAEETFTDTAQIIRTTEVSDGAGGYTETTAVIATVPCRIASIKLMRSETVIAAKLAGAVPWRITMPVGTDVNLADDILVAPVDVRDGDGKLVNARQFEVMGIFGPETYGAVLQAICAEK